MSNRKIAIVTGASSGLGKEFVKLLLHERGIEEIWCISRNKKKLAKLGKDYGKKIKLFSMDLSNISFIKEYENILKTNEPKIQYLINNAGYAKFCSYQDLTISNSLNMINLNINSVVAITLASIPYMDKKSHILNIASQASFQPLPYQNIYSSTKAFVRNYSRALNVELKGTGITVTTVCPGWMKTALYDRANINARKATNNFSGMVMPNKVARKALMDAKKNKDISVYSFYTKLSHLVAKILPQKIMMKLWLMQQEL